eukprot:scaffold3732_cov129-Isochrysis_galbana.AAC.4
MGLRACIRLRHASAVRARNSGYISTCRLGTAVRPTAPPANQPAPSKKFGGERNVRTAAGGPAESGAMRSEQDRSGLSMFYV